MSKHVDILVFILSFILYLLICWLEICETSDNKYFIIKYFIASISDNVFNQLTIIIKQMEFKLEQNLNDN